jgi:AcrR family transcriptional regulator
MAKDRKKVRDLGRTFELLWDAADPPARGPKRSLSVRKIVDTAIEIADAEGLNAVSMRRVAAQFDVTTMALYRYVPSKDDLLELMIDGIAHPPPEPADLPDHWREALHWWAHQQFAVFRRHPWLNDFSFAHPPMGPNNLQWMECAIQAILRSGIPEEEVIGVLMLLTNFAMAEARQQRGLIMAEAATGISYEEVGRVYGRMLEKVVTDGRHPGLTRLIEAGVFSDPALSGAGPDDDFEYGLTFVLDGIEAMVKTRQAG